LAGLEHELQATEIRDLWASQALQLRAAWRLQADDPNQILAREALVLIDRVPAWNATIDTYALRARAGLRLDDTPVFVESVAYMLNNIDYRMTSLDYYGGYLADRERNTLQFAVAEFEHALLDRSGVDQSGRASTVLTRLRRIKQNLDAY